jgi:hypothetical protein
MKKTTNRPTHQQPIVKSNRTLLLRKETLRQLELHQAKGGRPDSVFEACVDSIPPSRSFQVEYSQFVCCDP